MNKSESITKLAADLVAAQVELRNPSFDSTNPHFKSKFASLAQVRDTVTPILARHGLAVTQLLTEAEGGVRCETVLLHKSGEWLSSTLYMPATKQDAQGYGSASTYARRYALQAICGVVGDEDDDANRASAPASTKPVALDAWDRLTEADRVTLQELADIVRELLENEGPAAAMERINEENLSADHKVALWSRFDSKERSAMKKSTEKVAA